MSIKGISLSLFCAFSFFFGMLYTESYAACSVQEKDEKIEIKNPFCTMTFTTRGGACTSFRYNDKEFTDGKGMFEDLFWETPNYAQGEFIDVSYQYELQDKGPGKIVLRLWGNGNGSMKLIEYSKTITLLDSSSLIRIDYEIRNLPENMNEVMLTPWIHNFLSVNDEKNTYFFPEPSGVKGYDYDKEKPIGNLFVLNPVRGWTGLIGESGVGLAAIVDYRYLKQFYNCFGKSSVSVEWMLGPVKIKNGQSFKTTFYLHPFHGLNRLDGVSRDVVGELNFIAQEKRLLAKLSASCDLKGKTVMQYRRLPDANWTDLSSEPIAIPANSIQELGFPCNIEKDGTYLFRCSVSDEKNLPLVQIEKVFVIGKSSGAYEFTPSEKKLIKEQKKYSSFNIKEDIVTPHISWAKPNAAGKIKSLFVIDAVRSREVVELSQRLDMEYYVPTLHFGDPFLIGWTSATTGWSDGVKEMAPLIAKNYDCILVSGFHHSQKKWISLANKITEDLLPKINNGTGLIYIYPNELKGKLKELYDGAEAISANHFILSGGLIVPGFEKNKIRVAKYGKGRIVFLDYPGSPITPHGIKWPPEFNYWDYVFSFIAKAMLWASQKEPPVSIESCSFEKSQAIFNIRNMGRSDTFFLELNAMDKDGNLEQVQKKRVELTTGSDVQNLEIAPLKNGMHFLNFYIKNLKAETVNWATLQINSVQDINSSFKLDSDYCMEGGKLNGLLKINSAGKEEKTVDIIIRWQDIYDRTAFEKNEQITLKFPVTEFPISVPIDKSYSVYNQLSILVKENGNDVNALSEVFFINVPPEKRWKNYPVLLWHHCCNDSLPAYIQHYYTAQELKKAGVDSMFVYNALPILKAGMNVYLTGLYRQNINENIFKDACDTMVRKPCLSDPEFLGKMGGLLGSCAITWRKYSPTLYSIGDENSLTSYEKQCDICISKYCLPRFQKWLMIQYGDLKRLNLAWGTDFSRLEDVTPLNYKQIIERKNMNFSPWADHRTFMDSVFSNAMKFCKEKTKGADPFTAVGECGTSRDAAYGGWDWYKRLQIWEVLEPYSRYGDQLEIQRSFFKGKITGYTGYREGKFGLYCNWWWGLLNGEKGIAIWFTPLLINPDFTKTAQGEAVEEYAKGELKKGIGMLIAKSSRLHDGIAIHYSQPSLQASYILKNSLGYETLKQYYDNRSQWLKFLEGIGLQYEFIASGQIENGKLADGEYKILILPLSRAISDKEAESIKQFVNNGGILLADCQTGIFDEHVKIRKEGVFDSLFGLKRLAAAPITGKGLAAQHEGQSFNIDFCDPVIPQKVSKYSFIQGKDKKLGDFTINLGKYHEKCGAFLENSQEAGKAIYLNILPNGIPRYNDVLQNIFGKFIKPQIIVEKDGKPIRNLEFARFKCAETELVGIFQDPLAIGINPAEVTREEMLLKGIQAEVIFSKKSHVYNVRKGEYLGLTDRTQAKIAPGEALVYALVPYKIDNISLMFDNESVTAGEFVSCHISMTPEKGQGVVRLEVFDPDGNLSNCYTDNISLKDGKASLPIKTAFNDKTGRWKVLARDVISGKETVKFFELGKHK